MGGGGHWGHVPPQTSVGEGTVPPQNLHDDVIIVAGTGCQAKSLVRLLISLSRIPLSNGLNTSVFRSRESSSLDESGTFNTGVRAN